MPRLQRIPLAFKNLTHDYRRLALAVGGIGFAVLLMFVQRGFRYALFDSTVKIIDELDADLVIVNRAQYALPARQRFDRSRIVLAKECPGVADVYPLYIEKPLAVLRKLQTPGKPGHQGLPIRVFAFVSGDPVFELPAVREFAAELNEPGAALIDSKTKPKFGVPTKDPLELRKFQGELAGRRIHFVGTFPLGADFNNDGNAIMTARNFARYFPYRARGDDPLNVVDLGIVHLKPDADAEEVKRRLRVMLPGDNAPRGEAGPHARDQKQGDVTVFTRQEFRDREMRFWQKSTPIGVIFNVGTALGFVVGVIICYQIIFANISGHMPEFATLKAMGYRNRYFVGLVVAEAVYLSVLGFVPGALVSWALYKVVAEETGLLMSMRPERAAVVYLITLVMCVTSGCFAMRKVLSADPAKLF